MPVPAMAATLTTLTTSIDRSRLGRELQVEVQSLATWIIIVAVMQTSDSSWEMIFVAKLNMECTGHVGAAGAVCSKGTRVRVTGAHILAAETARSLIQAPVGTLRPSSGP